MRDIFRVALIVNILMLTTTGCAGSSSSTRNADPVVNSSFLQRYPANLWIVATGESTKGRADAESTARARVAEQVQSSLESEFRSVTQSKVLTGADGSETGLDSSDQSASIVTFSKFNRAELIRVLPDLTACRKDVCSAVAVLNRDETARAFQDEYLAASQEFHAAMKRATDVTPDAAHSVNMFATPYNSAVTKFKDMNIINMRAAAIGRQIPEFPIDRNALDRLNQHRESIMKGFIITVTVEGDAETKSLGDQFMKAFDRLGVSVVSASGCSDGLLFMPRLSVDCERAFIGTVCTPHVTAELRECGGNRVLTMLEFKGLDATGASTQNPRGARSAALSRLTPAVIAPELRTQLSNIIPLR